MMVEACNSPFSSFIANTISRASNDETMYYGFILLRYEEDHARPVDYCAKDSCWDDLGYPWQRSFKGDPHGYVIGFSLVWVVILAGTVAITKPWW